MVSLVYFSLPCLSHTRVHIQSRAHTHQLQDAKAKLEAKKLGEEAKRAAADAVTSTNFQVNKKVPDCAYGIHTVTCFHTHVRRYKFIHTHPHALYTHNLNTTYKVLGFVFLLT